jgi:hypothetical protein
MIEITQPTENQLTLRVRLSGYEMIFNSILDVQVFRFEPLNTTD